MILQAEVLEKSDMPVLRNIGSGMKILREKIEEIGAQIEPGSSSQKRGLMDLSPDLKKRITDLLERQSKPRTS